MSISMIYSTLNKTEGKRQDKHIYTCNNILHTKLYIQVISKEEQANVYNGRIIHILLHE